MMEERIGEVRVRVRTNVPDAEALRPSAERFVRATLERCATLLEERNPGRVMILRRLPLRWTGDETALAEASGVLELADAVADEVERLSLPAAVCGNGSSVDAVWFDDEAHFLASRLAAWARGQIQWFHRAGVKPAGSEDPWTELRLPNREELVQATLVRLARDNHLVGVLQHRAPAELNELGRLMNRTDESAAVPSNEAEFSGQLVRLRSLTAGWPALADSAIQIGHRAHAAAILGVRFDSAEAAQLAAEVARRDERRGNSPDAKPVVDANGTAGGAADSVESPGGGESARDDTTLIPTQFGGLFFLIDRVLELEITPTLWKACLPEADIITAAIGRCLRGLVPASDAAGRLLGSRSQPPPDLSLDQLAEVALGIGTELASALPRRGLASIPPMHLGLTRSAAGRLLVATPSDACPFAAFAWPAADPHAVRAGIRAFLEAWPHDAPIFAAPALAELDSTGRLRAAERDLSQQPLVAADELSSASLALLTMVIGAPALLFAARAGALEIGTVEEFVARFWNRPALIHLSEGSIQVAFATPDVDLDLRRAGLDRDPGWVPWLKRNVRFTFPDSADARSKQRASS